MFEDAGSSSAFHENCRKLSTCYLLRISKPRTACHKVQYFDLIENLENNFDIPQINKIISQRQNIFVINARLKKSGLKKPNPDLRGIHLRVFKISKVKNCNLITGLCSGGANLYS